MSRWSFVFHNRPRVLIQDNRQWGPSFVIRILRSSSSEQPFRKDAKIHLDFTLSAPGGVRVEHDAPMTIVAGKDWIPLQLQLDIESGSALDFSHMHLQDAPAGKHGWLRANPDGTFAFDDQPGKPTTILWCELLFLGTLHYP